MLATTLNQQLRIKYDEYVDDLYKRTWPSHVSAPLLIHTFEEYTSMDTKIMIVGQETHGWGGKITDKPTIDGLLKAYQEFKLGKYADYDDGKKPRHLKSQFWNFSRSLFYKLNGHISNVDRNTNGFIWTNVSKFDSNKGTPSEDLQERNLRGFYLLKDEITILNPDIVIFLTGTKYDSKISKVFDYDIIEKIHGMPLCRIQAKDGSLPSMTFKTEHPRTLCQHEKYKGDKMYHAVLNGIINAVKK